MTYNFSLSKEEYADLIITLGYAWENVRAENKEYHDEFTAERVERVKGTRDAVCNSFVMVREATMKRNNETVLQKWRGNDN